MLRQLLAEVRATPQVESAAATTNFLIGSGMWSLIARTGAASRDARFTWVSPGFFATLGTPILAGRDFTANDSKNLPEGGNRQRDLRAHVLPRLRPDRKDVSDTWRSRITPKRSMRS